MLMMHSLVYVSASDRRITGVDLQALMEQSRRHNAANDITGLLLHRSGTFLQFLEGSEAAVERLFASIEVDERHHDVVLVRRRTQPGRQFPNWTMEYGDVDPASTDPVAGTKPWTRGPDPADGRGRRLRARAPRRLRPSRRTTTARRSRRGRAGLIAATRRARGRFTCVAVGGWS